MANLTATAREYCGLLAKSRLLPADEVERVYRRWKDDGGAATDDVDSFRKHLVAKRLLTDWQAAMLQRGHADGFFLDGYKILDRVGKGQMGGVYRAVHALGQTVALKILPASKAKDTHTHGRFQRESRLLTQLDHPNVVRGLQVGESGGKCYIAMEYLDGETLDDVLTRRKKLPAGEAVRLVVQALDGLQHLHDRRTVHRDLKPANLMLVPAHGAGKPDTTWDATLKIVDVGLGRELFADGTPEGQIETQLTEDGAILGTPDYLAPEQAKDARTADVRADIYSLGCVLYHCLTGRPPFPDTNVMTQMLKHATEKPAQISSLAPGTPPGLQAVHDVMVAKSPDRRYPTPAKAAEALRPFLTPNAGAKPAGPQLVPEYREWLQTETGMEIPKDLPPAPPKRESTAVKPPLAKPAATAAPARPKPPAGPPPSYPAPLIVSPAAVEEVDVEVVDMAALGAPVYVPPPFAPTPAAPAVNPDDRPLTDLGRRDFMMLGAGGLGVLLAVCGGYGMAQLFRTKPTEPAKE